MYSSLRIATRARRPPPGDRLHRYRRQAEPDGLFPPRVTRTQRGREASFSGTSLEASEAQSNGRGSICAGGVGEPLIKRESNQSPP